MRKHMSWIRSGAVIVLVLASAWATQELRGAPATTRIQTSSPLKAPSGPAFESGDLYRLKSVGDVQLSPDGTHVAYTVQNNDRPGRPYSQVWIADLATGTSKRLGSDKDGASGPRWSRDGQQIAYFGREDSGAGVVVSRPDGSGAVLLAPVEGTNHPLPSNGERLAWSPDGKQVAFISATAGPETENANGDPMVDRKSVV